MRTNKNLNYKNVKHQLFPALAPLDMVGLDMIPHKQIEDMAVIYRMDLKQENPKGSSKTIGSSLIPNFMLDDFGITAEDLAKDALENALSTRPMQICSLRAAINSLAPEDEKVKERPEDAKMFVATVSDGRYGASVILYPGFFEAAARTMEGSFYILPSSVHEVILVKDDGACGVEDFRQMVREINQSIVEPEDRLTDSVYYYDANSKTFAIA